VLEDKKRFGFLSQWSAKIHLTMVVDDTAAINPGVTFIEPLAVAGTSRSLAIGAGLQTQAVRTEDIEFFLSFPDVIDEFSTISRDRRRTVYNDCKLENGLFLESDLDIKSMFDRALSPVADGVLRTGKNIPLPGGPSPIPAKDRQAIADAVKKLKATELTKGVFTDEQIKNLLSPEIQSQLQGRPDFQKAATILADALRIEKNAQAIIRNIVNPLYDIASASLAGRTCLADIAKTRYSATASSAVVSLKKIAVDNASNSADMQNAFAEMQTAEGEVVKAAQTLVGGIEKCSAQKPPAKTDQVVAYDPIGTISETVNFYITYSGSVTPMWKLVRLSAPLAPTFVNGTRKDTNTLIMVMGRPVPPDDKGKGGASPAMDSQILYSILREAIMQRPP
jgi:hypothetical protein